jgi:uncharacterized membrane protein
MEIRPKIKLELTPTDRFLEIAGWASLIFLWGLSIVFYSMLPEIIPTHFNAEGAVEDNGSKMSIMILPAIATMIFIGLTALNQVPHFFNIPAKITHENASRQYANATQMIRFLKLITGLICCLIVILIYRAATIGPEPWTGMVLPIVIAIIILPLIFFTLKSMRMK